jgi:EpsI family protein
VPEPRNHNRKSSSKTLWILLGFLAAQAALFAMATRREMTPLVQPLASIPAMLGDWRMVQESKTDPEVMAVLRADDVLNRTYAKANAGANLFVAFFASQRTGQAPHSPKNCLPGSGWVQEQADIIGIPAADGSTVEANRYVVARGESRSLVIYWYQSHNRTVASEYKAKVYVVADAIRYNRTDTALVRVIVPMPDGNLDRATAQATEFIRAMFPVVKTYLPA